MHYVSAGTMISLIKDSVGIGVMLMYLTALLGTSDGRTLTVSLKLRGPTGHCAAAPRCSWKVKLCGHRVDLSMSVGTRELGDRGTSDGIQMMMSFICSCRNKNRSLSAELHIPSGRYVPNEAV
jgi:hypothetical protein